MAKASGHKIHPFKLAVSGINSTKHYRLGRIDLPIRDVTGKSLFHIKDWKIIPPFGDVELRDLSSRVRQAGIKLAVPFPDTPVSALIGIGHPALWLWEEHKRIGNIIAVKSPVGWTATEVDPDAEEVIERLVFASLHPPHPPQSTEEETDVDWEYAEALSEQADIDNVGSDVAAYTFSIFSKDSDNAFFEPGVPAFTAAVTTLGRRDVSKETDLQKKNRLAKEYLEVLTSINQQLERHWAGESFQGEDSGLTMEEDRCIKRMNDSYSERDGKAFIDPLWKENQPQKGLNNFSYAKGRLNSVHQKLDDSSYNSLNKIFLEYEENGLIERVKVSDPYAEDALYWAMFPVKNPNSDTTPLRPVMDGAAKCLDGKSINEICFLKGPNLLNDLSKVLLRYRRYEIACMGDISKMFLKVKVPEQYRKYYRFLWCDRTGKEIIYYQFTGHLFGNNGSPTVSIFATQKNAQSYASRYPRAVEVIMESTIMDDHIDSFPTEKEAIEVVKNIVEIHANIGLTIAKFASNSPEVGRQIPASISKADPMVGLEKYVSEPSYAPGTESKIPQVRTLGQQWDMANDVMTYNSYKIDDSRWTKAACLSQAHKIFDPLGFLTPILLQSRLFMQKLWKRDMTWKDPITSEEEAEWKVWLRELEPLKRLSFPRKLFPGQVKDFADIQLHVFCDASKEAHAAVAYTRLEYKDGEVYTNFVMAKSRVTPTKLNRTIPKLELMALELGSQLATHVSSALKIDSKAIYLWTDSKTALQWLRMDPNTLQVLAHNYVTKILKKRETCRVRWIAGEENPADIPTRPKTVDDLLDRIQLWTFGPPFLHEEEQKWPTLKGLDPRAPEVLAEVKKDHKIFMSDPNVMACWGSVFSISTTKNEKDSLIIRCSKYTKALRIFSYVKRFVNAIRKRIHRRRATSRHLTAEELKEAKMELIRIHQKDYFPAELQDLRKNTLPVCSTLTKVGATLDDGIIRLSGRARMAEHLDDEAKRPYLLHPDGYLTKLLVRHYHESVLQHTGGIKCLLCELNRSYWVIGSIATIRRMLSTCPTCIKADPRTKIPKMAPLPPTRIPGEHANFPFTYVGIDACGPWHVKFGRGHIRQKRWVLVIRCTMYGALHLEMLYDMSETSFLAAFNRFTSRNQVPKLVYCDRGTNFVGGANKLCELWNKVQAERPEIKFVFSPAHSPHFNGLVEIMVKATKRALKTVISEENLTDEILVTALAKIENLMNNRPITYKGNPDARDPEPITPNHFLNRGRIAETLLPPADSSDPTIRSKLERVNAMTKLFYSRYYKEALPALQSYTKWATGRDGLRVGDVVIVLDDQQEKHHLGVISAAEPSLDGISRRFEVYTRGKHLHRSHTKLVLLVPADFDPESRTNENTTFIDPVATRTRGSKATKKEQERRNTSLVTFIHTP